jgi:hypothetical protein
MFVTSIEAAICPRDIKRYFFPKTVTGLFVQSVIWILSCECPFADGMISVLLHFLLRNYCFVIRTLADEFVTVNGEINSASESARD